MPVRARRPDGGPHGGGPRLCGCGGRRLELHARLAEGQEGAHGPGLDRPRGRRAVCGLAGHGGSAQSLRRIPAPHPQRRCYPYHSGQAASRLDRVYLPKTLLIHLSQCYAAGSPASDHRPMVWRLCAPAPALSQGLGRTVDRLRGELQRLGGLWGLGDGAGPGRTRWTRMTACSNGGPDLPAGSSQRSGGGTPPSRHSDGRCPGTSSATGGLPASGDRWGDWGGGGRSCQMPTRGPPPGEWGQLDPTPSGPPPLDRPAGTSHATADGSDKAASG